MAFLSYLAQSRAPQPDRDAPRAFAPQTIQQATVPAPAGVNSNPPAIQTGPAPTTIDVPNLAQNVAPPDPASQINAIASQATGFGNFTVGNQTFQGNWNSLTDAQRSQIASLQSLIAQAYLPGQGPDYAHTIVYPQGWNPNAPGDGRAGGVIYAPGEYGTGAAPVQDHTFDPGVYGPGMDPTALPNDLQGVQAAVPQNPQPNLPTGAQPAPWPNQPVQPGTPGVAWPNQPPMAPGTPGAPWPNQQGGQPSPQPGLPGAPQPSPALPLQPGQPPGWTPNQPPVLQPGQPGWEQQQAQMQAAQTMAGGHWGGPGNPAVQNPPPLQPGQPQSPWNPPNQTPPNPNIPDNAQPTPWPNQPGQTPNQPTGDFPLSNWVPHILNPAGQAMKQSLDAAFLQAMTAFGVQEKEAKAILDLTINRLAGDQVEVNREVDEALNSRGIFQSGIRPQERGRVETQFGRERTNQAHGFAQTLSGIAQNRVGAYSGYLGDIANQINSEAQLLAALGVGRGNEGDSSEPGPLIPGGSPPSWNPPRGSGPPPLQPGRPGAVWSPPSAPSPRPKPQPLQPAGSYGSGWQNRKKPKRHGGR